MSWKFWKKRRQETLMFEVTTIETPSPLPLSTLFRWYCYDMDVTNPNKLANQLGLSGISDDVEEMEKEASTERLEQIVPILPFLKSIASINSMVIAAIQGDIIQNKPLAEDKDLEDVLESVREIIGQISMSALVAGFSAAISLGVVHSSGAVAKEVDNEQF